MTDPIEKVAEHGNKSLCKRCGETTSCKRMGIFFYCPRCYAINQIAIKAQSGGILIIKHGEYWDFKHKEFADFIDAKMGEIESTEVLALRNAYLAALEAMRLARKALTGIEDFQHNDDCQGGHDRDNYASDEEAAEALEACECSTGKAVRAYRALSALDAAMKEPKHDVTKEPSK